MEIDPTVVKKHAEKSLLAYVMVRDKYTAFATALKVILESALKQYSIHTIQSRAKEFDSFAKKSGKLNSDKTALKYADPLEQITDMAGVRVITYISQTVLNVEDVVRNEFFVHERLDKDADLLNDGRIGYKSIHFLVQLKEPRINSPEYSQFKGMVAEIQVRTILQHAWAEMEHDIQYKSDQQIPNELRRRFIALAGLLEITDREFENIQKEDERLRALLTMELVEEISQLPSVEIDAQQDLDDQTVMVGVVDASAESAYTALAAALERYNSLIQAQPGQYAHFLGRAKAKFLLGDRSGALEDVRTAGELDPGNVHVNTVRQKIEDGRVSEKDTYHAAVSKYMSLGNGFLEKGDIGNAYLNYSKAEQLGAKKRISAFSFAMCACLKKDLVEVERHLMQAVPPKGSYEDVSHQILRLVTRSIIDKEDVALIEMRDGLVEMLRTTAYELDVSPLRFVRAAIGSMFDQDIVANATEIFSLTVKE